MTAVAVEMLTAIRDGRIRRKIATEADGLCISPREKGKPLVEDLAAFFSRRACGQRYRIVYTVGDSPPTVTVRAIGVRRDGDVKGDNCAIATKMRRRGEL